MKKMSVWASAIAALVLLGGGLIAASYSPSVVCETWHFHPIGVTPYTGTSTANIPVRFSLPSRYIIHGVGCSAQAITVTNGNGARVNVLKGGVSVLTAPILLNAQATTFNGTVLTTSVPDCAKDSVITIAAYGSGTPSVGELDVWMFVERSN